MEFSKLFQIEYLITNQATQLFVNISKINNLMNSNNFLILKFVGGGDVLEPFNTIQN
jgi:hypothetical protein